jgi:hypothetical protein
VFVYGAFVFITVYSYTELMDERKTSIVWESIRFLFSIGIFVYFRNWFGVTIPFVNYVIMGYFLLSLVVNIYFISINFEKKTILV